MYDLIGKINDSHPWRTFYDSVASRFNSSSQILPLGGSRHFPPLKTLVSVIGQFSLGSREIGEFSFQVHFGATVMNSPCLGLWSGKVFCFLKRLLSSGEPSRPGEKEQPERKT